MANISNLLHIIFTIKQALSSKLLPKAFKKTYEISDDAEKFIVDIFLKLTPILTLTF